ncbi:MAG: 2-oxoglutarate dehydrogenase component [Solirubrobacteraceae bacterium]|jgi:2-oxoglutarate dehydrogenase E1 component|nr:2-oxoglutarate dehydrogenase component [Solirubrobacteraceae bacterium]
MADIATIAVVMPQMGDSVSEGTILEWHKAAGDRVTADETIVEISTDKVDAEVPATASGTIVAIHGAEGDTIGVGELLAEIAADTGGPQERPHASNGGEQTHQTPSAPSPSSSRTTNGAGATNGAAATTGEATTDGEANGAAATADQPKASPVARRIAAVEHIDLNGLAGTGTSGRITKADVLDALHDPPAIPAPAHHAPATPTAPRPPIQTPAHHAPATPTSTHPPAPQAAPAARRPAGASPDGEAQTLRGAAAMLAQYMDDSRQIPTATSLRTMTVSVLDWRRGQLKAAGQKISYTHLIAYAIARAATDIPVMAHHFVKSDGKPTRIDDGAVNLGLAVDVVKKDGSRTLMVPVIADAGRLGFAAFLEAYDRLVEKARTNTLGADDLVGANLTLTNPGGLGTVASIPRLMVGQGTIVATGSIAYPVGLGAIGREIGAEKVMSVTSTYDHRIIQGAESGRFLARVEDYLQDERSFYEGVFAALGLALSTFPPPPAAGPRAAAHAGAPRHAGDPSVSSTAGVQAVGGRTMGQVSAHDEELLQAVQAAVSLVRAHRTHGHLAARLDPLGIEPEGDPSLEPGPLGLTQELMAKIPARILRMHVAGETLAEALPHLRETYCGTMAFEIEHIASHRQRVWLREKIESGAFRQPLTRDERTTLLRRLIEVDAMERFMHKAYLGQKQFSIEGLDMTVPMLDEMIQLAAAAGGHEVVIGMAHRGRLNVLAHNLGRPYETIFAEFEGASTLKAVTTIPQGGTGDVKYHHGAQGSYELPNGESILVNLESNPSHLEFVSPVVVGATRAAQTTRAGRHTRHDTDAAFPIVIHGDAAFPAQGVVAETFNLQGLDGYKVGGTLHLITNNQVGFTTDPDDARSTRWASDLAKGFDVPIIHVNADDVAGCVSAVRLAFAFRQSFGHDVLIDLIGYRRFGHNEADEPSYTQPEMYTKIKNKKRVCELWADLLVAEGTISAAEVDRERQEIWDNLTNRHQELKQRIADALAAGNVEQATGEYTLDRTPSPDVKTAVSAERLAALNHELLQVPDGFTVHPKLAPQLERRRQALGPDGGIGWAHAEALAFASLLTEGTPIRLTGQDAERGTFSQRHAVLHDAITGQTVCPIQNLPGSLAPLELHNSPLSEIGCLGFEYGYSQEAPETLVVWEAQFGDFVNAAQVIVDQFIVSGLAKWGQTSRLTLLLPHGYEGSGPEHSSGRLERFLQLTAEGNIRVANLTTPAQYFHLLRRQARVAKQRPLIVMTPKSLLRLTQATNRIEHLSEARFFPVLGEPRIAESQVRRLVLCTGKIYYDLAGHPDRAGNDEVAIGRVELLYPFPEGELLALIDRYPQLREVAWCQEEPRNMGARAHMSARLRQILPRHLAFGYVGRPERASPGEGYPASHAEEQSRIVRTALDASRPISQFPAKTPGER